MIFKSEPEGFSPRFTVVGCFLERDGKFLLLHRQPHRPEGGTWCAPGGKLESGEEVASAVAREVREETGVILPPESFQFFTKLFVRYAEDSSYDLLYYIFSVDCPPGASIVLQPDEHQAHRWVEPEEALDMNLIQDEDACIRLYYQGIEPVLQ